MLINSIFKISILIMIAFSITLSPLLANEVSIQEQNLVSEQKPEKIKDEKSWTPMQIIATVLIGAGGTAALFVLPYRWSPPAVKRLKKFAERIATGLSAANGAPHLGFGGENMGNHGESVVDLNSKRTLIVETAKKFLGNHILGWQPDHNDRGAIKFYSEFRLMFWVSCTDITNEIRNNVFKKYENAKNPCTDLAIRHQRTFTEFLEQRMYMSCWEFCFLVFIEADILTQTQIDSLLSIASGESTFHIAHALFQGSAANLIEFDPTNPPSPGDLFIFMQPEDFPQHVGLFIGEMRYIDLNWCGCNMGPLEDKLSPFQKMYVIPFETIPGNVAKFIEEYRKQ